MKIGYQYAIEVLLVHYRKLQKEQADSALIQQLKEGIEYLCYPWREDRSEHVRSPLIEAHEPEILEDHAELARRGRIHVQMAEYVWEVLKEIGTVKGP